LSRLGLRFSGLRGRPLQLIDCQNLFCEADKYARAVHPEVCGISGRTRIKQSYRQDITPLSAWFPPKWGLNGWTPPAEPAPPDTRAADGHQMHAVQAALFEGRPSARLISPDGGHLSFLV
jgi:hypothetical protein